MAATSSRTSTLSSTSTSSPPRVSSRKSSPPGLLHIPLPAAFVTKATTSQVASASTSSPRRHRGHHISLPNPGNVGLYTLSETDEDELTDVSRCPSLYSTYSNAPSSPGWPNYDSQLISTPLTDDADPFDDYSPMSDSFHPAELDGTPTPTPGRLGRRPASAHDIDSKGPVRSSVRPSAAAPTARLPRTSPSTPAPYPTRSGLLPALPILASWEQRHSAPPSTMPITPNSPDGMGVNLVTALRDLLTTCGEFDHYAEEDMFADAEEDGPILAVPQPSQFDDVDAVGTSYCPRPIVTVPATPPPKVHPSSVDELLRAPRVLPRPRTPLAGDLEGDHSALEAMSGEARAELAAARDEHDARTLRSMPSLPSLPSLSSSCSLSSSSASSSSSISSMAALPRLELPAVPAATKGVPTKPRISSRRPLRTALPTNWA